MVRKTSDKLQLALGDPVEVAGEAWYGLQGHARAQGTARIRQIDGLVRENAGVGLDEFVVVRKTTCRPAERVVLASAGGIGHPSATWTISAVC